MKRIAPWLLLLAAGLLHDIGLSSCLLMITVRPEWKKLSLEAVTPVLDAVHADASGLLARRWKLPEPLPAILATHHRATVDGKPQPVNAALIVAEQLCWEAGGGILEPPPGASPTATEMQEQPLDGLDVSWPSVVREALEILALEPQTVRAARVAAFDVVATLGGGA